MPGSAAPSPDTCAPTPCSWSPASPGSASTSSCRARDGGPGYGDDAVIQILLWAPLAAGLLAVLFPGRITGWVAALGPLTSLALAIAVVAQFDPSAGLQHTVNDSWIPTLGVRYALGVDGLSLFL